MQQAAWLNAAPRDKTARAKPGAEADKPLTRRRRMLNEGREPPMPPIDEACAYMVGYLFEAGPEMPGAAGSVPLTHSEIEAWARVTGRDITPWEASTMRRLSVAYVVGRYEADELDAPAPWMPSDQDAMSRRIVGKKISAIFGGRSAAKKEAPDARG